MKNLFKKAYKGMKKMLSTPIDFCKEIIEDKDKLLILSFVLLGLGGGLLASVYVQAPN